VNIRRGRNFKKKKPFFSFGYFLLPMLGLLALGFLILGVRLLFFQPHNEYEPIESLEDSVVVVEQPKENPTTQEALNNGHEEGYEEEKIITAVPVKVPSYKETEDANSKLAQKSTEEDVTRHGQSQSSASNNEERAKAETFYPSTQGAFWSVQVGAFTKKVSAENLARELQKAGYDVFIVSAEVGGKKYHRVRVKAGDTKQEAQKVAGKLSAAGYPTFIAYEK